MLTEELAAQRFVSNYLHYEQNAELFLQDNFFFLKV